MKKLWRNKNWLFEQYVTRKKSMRDICRELNIGEACIHKWLHRFNIPIRSRSESLTGKVKTLEHKRKLSEWGKTRVGSLNPFWNGGKSPEKHRNRYRGWRQRNKEILERDNFECQICGLDMDLHIHHILPYHYYPDLVNDYDNLLTLCQHCHRKVHFGLKNSANSANPRTGNAEPSTEFSNELFSYLREQNLGACVETIYGTVRNN
jgi:predicted HNH restriction endonuclease